MTSPADTSHAEDAAQVSLAADLWPPEAIEAIRVASLELLARVGVRVDSAEAEALLKAAGGSPGPQGRVLLPAAVVAAALESCRGEYAHAGAGPRRDLSIGPAPGRIHVHNMGEAPAVGDPRTGRTRPATFRDQALAARVMHHQRFPDSINSLVTPGDVPAELHPLYSYLAIAAETDKPIGGPGQDHAWQTPVLFEMAAAVLSARPGGVPAGGIILDMGYSPVSPLHLGAGVCDGIIAAARLGMAVQVLTNPVAGTTAPASLAGALAQQDAEILAGVVLAQAAAPGAACGYGARLSVADPRDGRLLCGAGRWALASVGATLLARRHGLACDCYGPDTSAPLVDVQAGYQQALPALAGALARPCMMSGIGAWGDASTCLELLVVGDADLPPGARLARAAGVGRGRPRRRRDDRGRHRPDRLPRHAAHAPLAARQPRLRGPQLARRSRGVDRRGQPGHAGAGARARAAGLGAASPSACRTTWRPSSAASSTRRRPGSASPATRTRAACSTRRGPGAVPPSRPPPRISPRRSAGSLDRLLRALAAQLAAARLRRLQRRRLVAPSRARWCAAGGTRRLRSGRRPR